MRPDDILPLVVCVVLLSVTASSGAPTVAQDRDPVSAAHVEWVAQSLREMENVKPGMTRGDLLEVFRGEGGFFNGLRRTYAYRRCPYFKVHVEFEPVGRSARDEEGRITLVEAEHDVIKSISRPYLQWSIID